MVLRRHQVEDVRPQLQEIGRLFKGSRKIEREKNGKKYLTYGKDLEFFRFEPADRLNHLPGNGFATLFDELAHRWQEMEQATSGWKSIPILLPYKTIDQNLFFRNAVYDGGGRTVRSCDGQTCDRYPMEVRTVANGGGMKKVIARGAIRCSMKEGDTECPEGCKSEGKLSMIIPGLYPGLVILTTKSTIDIQTLSANLKGYERFDLSRIPLRLCRSLRDASYTDPEGNYKKQEKWLLHIEVDPQFGHAALQAQQEQYKAELLGARQPVQLPPAQPAYALPAVEVEAGPVLIGADQLTRMNALANQNGYDLADLKAIVTGFGFTKRADITLDVWPEIEAILSQPKEIEAVEVEATA